MYLTKFLSPFVLMTLVVTTAAMAQSNADTLVGMTNNITSTGATSLDMQVPSFSNCSAATSLGNVGSHSGNAFAGGTAYDPRHQAVWASDGSSILLYRPSDKKILCQFKPTLQISQPRVGVVSGLAFSPSRRELYQLETITNQMALTIYDVTNITNCNPGVKKGGCIAKIGTPGETAGGLAYDEVRDLFYYVTSWYGFARPGFTIYAAPRNNPCQLTSIMFSPCSDTAPAFGAAYGACTRFLYIAKGNEINVVRMDDPLNGKTVNMNQLLKVGCCQKQNGHMWSGLALIPRWSSKRVGSSCLSAGCGTCSSMKLDLGGGAMILGNPDVALTIADAPTGGTAAFYISLGNCSNGVGLPGLCGQVYPAIGGAFPMLLGVFPLGGQGGTCAGSLNFKLGGVPRDASLCGVSACSQFLIRCATGGAGLTNALEFSVGG
ncbi:MAG: hypothetical protein ACYTGO_17595 [Planctomycetota bacterium]|jgi:hypothetical protein